MFVTFEGLDFSGKTTQAQRLVNRLKACPPNEETVLRKVHFIREPGGTHISERLRDILLDRKHLEMCNLTELMLFSASRAQLVFQVIGPALKRGEDVICDRYHDSTTVYQGYGRGLNIDDVRRINAIATNGLDPELTVLVDIPVDEIERRKVAAGLVFDRMESSGLAFYERVRQGYLALAREEPDRFVRINGMKSVEQVEADIWRAVTVRMNIHQQSG